MLMETYAVTLGSFLVTTVSGQRAPWERPSQIASVKISATEDQFRQAS